MRACLLVLLALGALAAGDEQEKNRPVTKVINLLKDMLKQMEKEGEEDQDIYEKMGCWCVTNEKSKTESIAKYQADIVTLQATIESTTADSARLNAEVAQLQRETEKNTAALGEATALREKQLAEFNQEEKETLVSITSLKGAIQTLSQAHKGAFIQLGAEASANAEMSSMNLVVTVRDLLRKHKDYFQQSLMPHQRRALEEFASQPQGYSLLQAKYAPQSGAIFGILKQMKEDMETSLANSSREEEKNVADYNALKSAKTTQIADATDLVETKSGETATADEAKASAKVDLENTEESLDTDNKFLSDLKVRCTNMDAEFEQRTKDRQLEMQAVGKALEFLSSDEAHDLFTRTFNPSLLQRSMETKSQHRLALAKLLRETAKKTQDPRLSALAVRARLDAFEEVKNTITSMIDKLLKEQDDDIKHKDYCIDEFNNNEVDTANKNRELDQTHAKIESLAVTIEELGNQIETLKAEIAQLQVDQKKASAERDEANAQYQSTVSDQKATQQLLATALDVLKSFYEKAALLQTGSKQPPPPGFKAHEKSAASGGVMGMMQKIIDEAKALEAEAVRSEEEAQADFEEFTRDTTKSIEDKTKEVVNKSEEKAQAEGDQVQKETERDTILSELEELAQGNADLHRSCDFLMKNFDLRRESRDAEVEALKKGLALFSGASFASFLQHA